MKIVHFTLLSALMLSGCMNFRYDVSNSTEAWGQYDPGSIYELKIDVFLREVGCCGNEPERLALVPSRRDKIGGYYSSPESIDEYLKHKKAGEIANINTYQKLKIVGVVKSGTQLSPYKISRNSGYSWWGGSYSSDYKYAKILSGEFTGEIVDIQDVTLYKKTE